MKTLVVIPQSRTLGPALASVLQMEGAFDLVFLREGDDPAAHRFANCTRKCEAGRLLAARGHYEALLLLDDDMIVPPDTLTRLQEMLRSGADIAYGFTVWRNPPHHWSAASQLDEPNTFRSLDMDPAQAEAAWGKVVEVNGVGSFCTLLPRRIFMATHFHRRGEHCFDYYLAVDAQRNGWRQMMDLGLLIGHINMVGQPHVIWPAADAPYWREELL